MFFHFILLAVSLMSFMRDFLVSTCDPNCADKPEFTPSRLVVKYGDPILATCSVCQQACIGKTFDVESPVGWKLVKNETVVSWTVDSLTEWRLSPTCFYRNATNYQCCTKLPITVYEPPNNVSISFVNHSRPMVEGHRYTLQCKVEDVAPVENLTVTFYKGQTTLGSLKPKENEEYKPVTEDFLFDITPSKEDDGVQYWCEAKLELGREGPQPPPVVMSQKIPATVYYKPQIKEPPHPVTITVTEGEPLQLNCSAVGNPSPSYNWTLPSRSSSTSNSSVLFVSSAASADEGSYTCSVSNNMGTDTVVFIVRVQVLTSTQLLPTPTPSKTTTTTITTTTTTTAKTATTPNSAATSSSTLLHGFMMSLMLLFSTLLTVTEHQSSSINIVTEFTKTASEILPETFDFGISLMKSLETVSSPRETGCLCHRSHSLPGKTGGWTRAYLRCTFNFGRIFSAHLSTQPFLLPENSVCCQDPPETMSISYIVLVVSLMNFLRDFHVSGCDPNCADKPEFTPSRLVVKYRDPILATCSVSQQASIGSKFDVESPVGKLVRNGTTISWTVDSLTEWRLLPTCFYSNATNYQCCTKLPITVYQPPNNVSISFVNHSGPMVEGHRYTLQCKVEDVAPVENLIVTLYKGQTTLGSLKPKDNEEYKPVTEDFLFNITSSKEDDGVQYWCEAKLELGPEGPQSPPVVMSKKIPATVYYSPQIQSAQQSTIFVTEGNPLQLNCSAVGNPSPSYTWELPSDHPSPFNGSILTINSVTFGDEGTYTCSVHNNRGNDIRKFVVDVQVDIGKILMLTFAVAVSVLFILGLLGYFYFYKPSRMGQYNLKDVFRLHTRHSTVPTAE
ncbi:neural cell adhesion molecule L1-like [Plectropomus leopardus]|uniref:neural cell adhesion molecule L1-like n=1 Tax=Plectropomus leopardus TaxID=160734 RepID=UPI001C4DCAE0|nr:neural cell adhesion molecule L1-like [Plectropomus leopardus]